MQTWSVTAAGMALGAVIWLLNSILEEVRSIRTMIAAERAEREPPPYD